MNRAVFLDLNGTLVEPVQIEWLEDLTIIPGALEAVAKLNRAGFLCPVVTVQSRIAKGFFTEGAFLEWFAGFAEEAKGYGAELLGPYVCPHAFAEPCPCKKPQPYLYAQAARDHDITLASSYIVGDTAGDIEAAVNVGASAALVQTGWGHFESNLEAAQKRGAFIGRDVAEVAAWIEARASQYLSLLNAFPP
jgi:D-glycero-D-manno-heptose 1,7-bisphosphate phosphatase